MTERTRLGSAAISAAAGSSQERGGTRDLSPSADSRKGPSIAASDARIELSPSQAKTRSAAAIGQNGADGRSRNARKPAETMLRACTAAKIGDRSREPGAPVA